MADLCFLSVCRLLLQWQETRYGPFGSRHRLRNDLDLHLRCRCQGSLRTGTFLRGLYLDDLHGLTSSSQIPDALPAPKEVGDGFYTFPCNATLAPISLQLGSKQYAVDPRDFNLGQATK